ncbi:MAG: hypothetical protein M0013_03385 [Actinomycetota bacterium]|nr:hypothetical protein [Actinomycetota bacterium]
MVLGGRPVSTQRPRGWTTGGEEIALDTWKVFSSADLLNSLVVERVLAGVATRRHVDGAKALAADINKVFGEHAVVQRCTIHKRRINRPSLEGSNLRSSVHAGPVQPALAAGSRWSSVRARAG